MHVGLNLIFCVPGETGGMEVAARETIPHLVAQPGLRVTAFVSREGAGTFEGVEQVVVPVDARNRVAWVGGEQLRLPLLAARAGVDIVHSLGSTAPFWGRFRRVTTVHDINYKIVPEAHFGLLALGMRVLVPGAVRRSHRIVAVSETTKADLVEHLHARADRIDVVPQGVSAPVTEPTSEPQLRQALALGDRPVVLCVGARRPHKNAAAVIRALPELAPRPVLVITGYRTPHVEDLRALADDLGVGADIRLPDRSSEADLEGLYALASAVVVPSLYEGFGLPVLEAMIRGVPVAASNRASLPEVAGDAALLFDPADHRAVRDAIATLLSDRAVAARLAAAGPARAAHFSWERTARLSAEAYRRAMATAP